MDQYAEKYGLVVPYSTVAEWMRKARGTSRRDFAWQIPWQLPEGSFTPRQLRRLRWLYRYDNGGTLSESQRREVAALLRLLEPTVGGREFADLIRSRRTELVLEYVAKSGRWEYVRRRPQIDLGWVREPWWNDLGELRSVTELREMGVRESLLTDFVESGVPPMNHRPQEPVW